MQFNLNLSVMFEPDAPREHVSCLQKHKHFYNKWHSWNKYLNNRLKGSFNLKSLRTFQFFLVSSSCDFSLRWAMMGNTHLISLYCINYQVASCLLFSYTALCCHDANITLKLWHCFRGRVACSEALGLCFEMYHVLVAACFVLVSRLYRQRWREWAVEQWINEDKERGPLGMLLYSVPNSTLTRAERIAPRFTIQSVPRGTITSRSGKRGRKKEKERAWVCEWVSERERTAKIYQNQIRH